ncbi:hypothetical protein [Paenibacillus sp. Marseille-Q4541]|uniref:hypothetical protein n=1 Tax=Paenibacillus sp. Marseille-Q4541 TaxID=2831522 RepID=UPI001BA9692D|nr:hypothetical protein [Paenibacillus sp. Marseille-Q4541]
MTSIDDKNEKDRIDEAWQKLTSKLGQEEMSPKWAAWAPGHTDMKTSQELETEQIQNNRVATNNAGGEMSVMQMNEEKQVQTNLKHTAGAKKKRSKKQPAKKWISIAAAAAIAGVMVATPLGDKALAAILNQFRMDEVTAVDERDLMEFISTISGGDGVHEFISKYGTFTNESGDNMQLKNKTAKQIGEQIGLKAITGELIDTKDFGVGYSQKITMKLDISKVNATMKRLGADDLMPESLNGQVITLQIPETLSQGYSNDSQNKHAYISQQKIPTVHVDSSVAIEDAVKAVLNFPLMSDHLKTAIQTDQILEGKLPMPVFTDGSAEKISVDGIPVILEQDSYNYYGPSGSLEQITKYVATWTKNDVLYRLDGDTLFDTKEKMEEQIKELMSR